MEFGAKIMVLATTLLVCLLIASTQAEPLQRRISRRELGPGTALISDLNTSYGYQDQELDKNVEAMLRRTLLQKTYWRLCIQLNACPDDTTPESAEKVLPPRTSRGHLFWRTGVLVPPGKGKK